MQSVSLEFHMSWYVKAVITHILKKKLSDIKRTREMSLNLQELRNPNLIIFECRKGIARANKKIPKNLKGRPPKTNWG